MIAITGATGQLGQLVMKSLMQKTDPANIIALARNPDALTDVQHAGVTIRQADYNQPDTLKTAFEGARKVLLISGSEVGQRVAQHQAVIDAVNNADVELFAYTSILKADASPLTLAKEHKATEEAIKASKLPSVILRNGWYSENYTVSVPIAVQMSAVIGTAGAGRFSTASRQDLAEAAVAVLLSSENQVGKIYELAGDTSFTLADFAAEIAAQTGREIRYQQLDQESFSHALKQAGVPGPFAEILAETEFLARDGVLQDDSRALSSLIGRPTTPIADSIEAALAAA